MKKKYLIIILIFFCNFALAISTYEEVLKLEKNKRKEHNIQAPLNNGYSKFPDGKTINLSNWQLILFMQGKCKVCHDFDPILKEVAQQFKLDIFVYTLDGLGDLTFPKAIPAPKSVIDTFFINIPLGTPTIFLINTNTLVALPVMQGGADSNLLSLRLLELFSFIKERGL